MIIWYALFCKDNLQKRFLCENLKKTGNIVPGTVIEFTYERMRRYEGQWHMERMELFPDCVIIESTEKMQTFPGNLCTEVFSVKEETVRLLQGLCRADGCIPFSRGAIRKGVTLVTEGPLKGHEEMITRLDRHKRLASLRLSLRENADSIRVGLEITEKTGE